MKKKIAIIGSGISGLSAAAYSALAGNDVHVFEKNSGPGGRARQLQTDNGYTYDMGPSWYWMPDIIENFFQDFGHQASEFYELISLDPQFEIIFPDGRFSIPKNYDSLRTLFENTEKGAGKKLDKFMRSARMKYITGMQEFAVKPGYSWREFVTPKMIGYLFRLNLFTNFRNYVARYFKHPKLRALMEFPVIFLGASPDKIPAFYSLMNYGGYALGTWYPSGGFYEVVKAMKSIAESQGAKFYFNHTIEKINTNDNCVMSLTINGDEHIFDAVIASSDYHHSETLLDTSSRNYSERYWENKIFAPSCLIYYLGFRKKIPNLNHHTLFFEYDMEKHLECIYGDAKWPENPLFYACCTSKTDPGVAPENHENLFLLMPLAIGIKDEEATREVYLSQMLKRIESLTGEENLLEFIDYKKSYCVRDFMQDYNAYKGNAYGLANTLNQTAVLKPSIKNRKLNNLFYTGQLTVPGPGVPPSIISGKIVANEANK